jgi:4'-phosphopantetheinyl transferase EntD
MIAEILPAAVAAVEARSDPLDIVLFPAEEAVLGEAVEKRRREFATARACARKALAELGLPPLPILSGARGEPLWPAGIVGSITHCHGYRACAVARASDLLALGIDAEPNEPLPDGVLEAIATPEERSQVRALARTAPQVRWDRLLFSAKESVYKTWFPLAGRPLGFEDATLTFHFDVHSGAFSARLLVPGPPLADGPLRTLAGRWLARDGLLLTAIALRHRPPPSPSPAQTSSPAVAFAHPGFT